MVLARELLVAPSQTHITYIYVWCPRHMDRAWIGAKAGQRQGKMGLWECASISRHLMDDSPPYRCTASSYHQIPLPHRLLAHPDMTPGLSSACYGWTLNIASYDVPTLPLFVWWCTSITREILWLGDARAMFVLTWFSNSHTFILSSVDYWIIFDIYVLGVLGLCQGKTFHVL